MIVSLDVPYADSTAADLSFALDLPPQPALHALDLPGAAGPGTHLQLRLLGSSHQAILDLGQGTLSETVACLPAGGTGLPTSLVTLDLPAGWRYVFVVDVTRCTPAAFAAEVAALRVWDGATLLLGEFPGAPGATTALRAEPFGGAYGGAGVRGASWQTAHTYPQTGEIVRTRTVIRERVPR